MNSVFICYAKEDYNIAKSIYNDLCSNDIICWLDTENLLPGQNWANEINKAITNCSYFILLISSNSISKKGFIQKEQKTAFDLLKTFPTNQIFIIPVKIDDSEPTDENLKSLHWVNLTTSYSNGLQKILQVISPNNLTKKNMDTFFKIDTRKIKDVQEFLSKKLGYYKGYIDGIEGEATKVAIKNFQMDFGLFVDGIIGPQTLEKIEELKSIFQFDIKTIQFFLYKKGFFKGSIDGFFGNATKDAVKKFQEEYDLYVDGIIGLQTYQKINELMNG